MKSVLQVLPKKRENDFFALAEEIYRDDLTTTHVRDLFFVLAQQSAFASEAIEYGLTYIPQYGPDAGDIFHFVTKARVGTANVTELVLEYSNIAGSKTSDFRPSLPENLVFIYDELRRYSSNAIGVVWCIMDRSKVTDPLKKSITQCSQLIEFMTKKFKLANAISSLFEIGNNSKLSEKDIDLQLVQSLRSAVAPDSVMLWRLNQFTGRLTICEGTHNWELKLDQGEGVAGKCAAENATIIINDFTDRSELKSKGISSVMHQKFVDTLDLRSGTFDPVAINNRCDSVVACYFKRPNGVTKTETDIIRFIINNYRYYRTLFKLENTKIEGREKIQRVAALMTFVRDARSYVHDASTLVNKADQHLIKLNPRTDEERSARQVIGQAMEQARKHLSNALALTEPAKVVRSENVLFESDDDVARHNITKIIGDTIAFYEVEVGEQKIKFKLSLPPDLRFSLSASKLRRALTNLIDNAIYELRTHPTPHEKIIEVEARIVEGSSSVPPKKNNGRYLVIFVRDTGPGIKKEIYAQITEYFVSTKGEDGYGFGMGIVKDIMEAHGGAVLWRNKNKGAEFELRFPDRN